MQSSRTSSLQTRLSRRTLLRASGLALTGTAAAALVGCGESDKGINLPDGNGPLEVTRLRIPASNLVGCPAPFYYAISLLEQEGFKDVEIVPWSGLEYLTLMNDGKIDFDYDFAGSTVTRLDRKDPVVAIGGLHTGCYQLIGRDGLTRIADINTVGVLLGDDPLYADQLFMAQILYGIGLNPDKTMVSTTEERLSRQLESGELDAVLAVPPWTHRILQMGHSNVLIDSAKDPPFAQYICCIVVGNNEFVHRNPSATKRFLRAVMKATDAVALDPEEVTQYLVDKGHVLDYEEARAELRHVRYDILRKYNVEDALRFNALRLKEGGVIRSTPEQILRRGMGLRYFNELRQEMAAAPTFRPARSSAFAVDCDIDLATNTGGFSVVRAIAQDVSRAYNSNPLQLKRCRHD